MFCLEIFFDRIYAILSQNLFSCLTCFDAIYALSMWRKIQPKFCPWRKMTNIMYDKEMKIKNHATMPSSAKPKAKTANSNSSRESSF